MTAEHRRVDIISILFDKRHTTARKLAEEFYISIHIIQYIIQALFLDCPIYPEHGENEYL